MRAGIMKEIVRYLGIDTRSQLLGERLWQHLEEPSSEIIGAFYRDTQQSAAGLLLDESIIERLSAKQKEHWRLLFNSGFDEAYLRRATLIGIKHHEIGLDPKWYVAAYALMKARFAEHLLLHTDVPLPLKSALVVAFEKYVAVDMALALSSYSSWLVD
jgi:protoglobin